ncbi:MAG: SDR family NAD(P)-dependent oxidoreductase [Acidiferrobacter sp.]
MKVLITGGAGFIGSHLADRLVTDGHHVVVLDNLTTGKTENLRAAAAQARFIRGDVRDQETVHRALSGMDAVVHLAAVASVQASMDDPLATHATNLGGTLHCLNAAADLGVSRVLYASSAAIYGDDAPTPVTERATPAPLSPYAIDKLAGEQYLAYFARERDLNATAFRFFNVFGPRQDASSPYSGVISLFADRLAANLPFLIYGDGRQTRDFVYVEDLVDILAQALVRRDLRGVIMNVGSGVEQELRALVAAFEEWSGRTIACQFLPTRSGDIRRSCADITQLRAVLGRAPDTTLRKGLARFLECPAVPVGRRA